MMSRRTRSIWRFFSDPSSEFAMILYPTPRIM
jgi:hypothetical protein